MPSLQQDFKAIKEALAKHATAVTSFLLEDNNVTLKIRVPEGVTVTASVIFTDADSYPHAGALLLGEDDSVNTKLEALAAEHFSESAALPEVVRKILGALGLNVDLGPAATSKGADADTEMGSRAGSEAASGDEYMSEEDEGGDDEDGDEYGGVSDDDDDDEDRYLLIDVGTRISQWEKVEKEREAGSSHEQAHSLSQKEVMGRQIFKTHEAFSMLSRELIDIFKAQSPDLFADAVGGDVYRWEINVGGFDPDSAFGKDLLETQKRWGFSMVQLRINFMYGLHPFYPPSVEVVRPHLRGPALGVLASHPLLRLQNWDPWQRQVDVITLLKSFLQAHTRVDLDHPGNGSGGSAYTELERQLARLEALCCVLALQDPQHQQLYRACEEYKADECRREALQSSNKRSRAEEGGEKKTYWKAGTGYGSTVGNAGAEVWDAKASEAAQQAQDRERQGVLQQLAEAIREELGPWEAGEASTSATNGTTSSSSSSSQPPPANGAARASPPPSSPSSALYVLRYSCLVPFVLLELIGGDVSLTDMSSARSQYFRSLLEVVRQLARPETLGLLTLQLEGKSVAGSCLKIAVPCRRFHSMLTSSREERSSKRQAAAAASPVNCAALSTRPRTTLSLIQQQEQQQEQQEEAVLALTAVVVDIADRLQRLGVGQVDGAAAAVGAGQAAAAQPASQQVAATGAGGVGGAGGANAVAANGGGGASGGELDERAAARATYLDTLRPLQVSYVSSFASGHFYSSKPEPSNGGSSRERSMRVMREMMGLQGSLPLTETSSIAVCVNEAQHTNWKVLIVGPEDTPYAGGCFLFDLYFPPQYPAVPPQVQFKTTGAGSIRFNPNLYNCGKVCLSLLGTWSGGKGEGWNRDASSALQVLISIQSLILVEHPYFNEPGFETSIGTVDGDRKSMQYNKVIREGTVKWAMVEYLKSPPAEFKEVIQAHFRLRGASIVADVRRWVGEAAGDRQHAARLEALLVQLEAELSKLSEPAAA